MSEWQTAVPGGVTRQQVLERVERWLDTALAPEASPDGIDPQVLAGILETNGEGDAREYDAFAAWATITALTQEVKLQSRSFKELADAVNAQSGRVGEELRAAYREREREQQKEVERRCRREIIAALLDLRESLERGQRSANAANSEPLRKGWLARLAGRRTDPTAGTRAALLKGYELSIERLDRMLEEWNVKPIVCQSQLFDPLRMNAVDIEETDSGDGVVTEVYRAGWEWNSEVFRTAQVRVARTRREGNNTNA